MKPVPFRFQTSIAPTLVVSTFISMFTLALAPRTTAQVVPAGFTAETLLTNLNFVYDFCFLPDGRIVVVEGHGDVLVSAGGAPAAVIGTVANVNFGLERGLLSVIADPNFATNGYVYTWSCRAAPNRMALARFTLVGDLTDATSSNLTLTDERVLLETPDDASVHNGGSVRFGPDGKLYLTVGDDGDACDTQDPSTSKGVLLRMDVANVPPGPSSSPPPFALLDPGDNPMSGTASIENLVLAFGLRNPWRMEIDPATGHVYFGDVGNHAFEEFDEYLVPTPVGSTSFVLRNYGWPWREGFAVGNGCSLTMPAPPGLVDPMVDVGHAEGWSAALGGPIYRTVGGVRDFPASYDGQYFYGDYFSGEIRRLENVGGTWQAPVPVAGQPSSEEWASGFGSMSALRRGPDGALYYSCVCNSGILGRIRPTMTNQVITAFSGDGQFGVANEAFVDPVVVAVTDASGTALAGIDVQFTATGPATLSSSLVPTDAAGHAAVVVTATNVLDANPVVVTANTAGSGSPVSATLFRRNLHATYSASGAMQDLLVLSIENFTAASPPNVPYLLMATIVAQPSYLTFVGALHMNPFRPDTLVFEDPFGLFGGGQSSPNGSVGQPNLVKVYSVPAGVLSGLTLRIQGIGFDSDRVEYFRTDCAILTP